MVYLGSLLSADGRIEAELSRRLGMAQKDFQILQRVWAHANISKQRKTLIYNACIVSTLLYGLGTAWLNASERRRLDAFNAKCLRKLMGISPSYYSRVSNDTVLRVAKAEKCSTKLLRQQLLLFGKIARMPAGTPLRDILLEPGSCRLRTTQGIRNRGRPRTSWPCAVRAEAVRIVSGEQHLVEIIGNVKAWRKCVCESIKD